MESNLPNPTGQRVIILAGPYAGHEGVCLGRTSDGSGWMVSPDCTNEIIPMVLDREFGILLTRNN